MEPFSRKKESYTYYVTRSPYDPATFVPTDAVLFSFTSPVSGDERLPTYPQGAWKKELYGGICANQDVEGWYTQGRFDGETHEEDIFTKRDGSFWGYNLLRGIHYILPTRPFMAYLRTVLENMIRCGATHVGLSEMGIYGEVGFEQSFRREWEAYYGEPWQPFWDDPERYFRAQHLKNRLMERQVREVYGPLKREHPDVCFLLASHTAPAYFPFCNPVGNHDIMALDCVDGIEAQTWSNTLELPFSYDGVAASRPFVTGYGDYSYWANLGRQFPDKKLYFVTDPKGDGYTEKTLEHCIAYYKHQLVTQLFFSNVCRYCSCEWPDRAYSEGYGCPPFTTPDYKVVMNRIISLQGQMYRCTEPTATDNRPLRVGAVLLDTADYTAGGPQNTENTDSFYGLTAGLIYNGLLVDSVPMGEAEDAADILDGYAMLLLSFDLMKPAGRHCTERLSHYVREGGTLLLFHGGDNYDALSESWWRQAGHASPAEELLSRLHITAADKRRGTAETEWVSPVLPMLPIPSAAMTFSSVEGAEPIAFADGRIAAFCAECGRGRLYLIGLSPARLTAPGMGDWLFETVRAVSAAHFGVTPEKRPDIAYRRGRVCGVHAVGDGCRIPEGTFVDLFDPELRLRTDRRLQKGGSLLLWDVADRMTGEIPRVLFAPGRDPRVEERETCTKVFTDGPARSLGAIRIYKPRGCRVAALTAACAADGEPVPVTYMEELDGQTLLVRYQNRVEGVRLELHYEKLRETEEVGVENQ